MLRKARLAAAGAAGALLVASLAAHAPPVRALVLRYAADALRHSFGIVLRAESLSYNLLTLSAELRGIEVAAVDTPAEPFASADTLDLSFAPRTLIGDIGLRQVSITSLRLDIRRHADGSANLPRVSSGESTTGGLTLPPLHLQDVDLSFQQPSASVVLRGAELQLTSAAPGRMTASARAQRGVTIRAGARAIDLGSAAVVGDLESGRLEVRELTASRPSSQLRAAGSIVLRGDASTVDLTATATTELQSWWPPQDSSAPAPVGPVNATAHVTGLLFDPAIAIETSSDSITWSDVQASEIRARGDYTRGEMSLRAMTLSVGGGTVEAHGALVFGDSGRANRLEIRWAGIDAGRIPGATALAGVISKSGSGTIEWRTDGTSSPRFDLAAATGLTVSGRTIPIVVHASGRDNRWQAKATPDTGVGDVTATAAIVLDSKRWQRSTIDGRVVLRAGDLPAAIDQARQFGIAADIDSSTAAGAIDLEASVEGTLGAVRSAGRITGRGLTVAHLPKSDLDAAFAVDIASRTTTGTFRLAGLEPAALPSEEGVMTFGASVVAEGTWSGPLNDPAAVARVTGRNLTIARSGSISIATTGGSFDAVVKGPAGDLVGEGTLTVDALALGGRNVGAVDANLSMAGGRLRVQARAPDIKTTMDGSIGLQSPNAFEGHAALTDYDISALLELTGLALAETSDVRGRLSSAIDFHGDLNSLPATNIAIEVAPIDATVFGVPVAMRQASHATAASNRLQVEDTSMTIGGLAVSLGGSVSTGQSTGRLLLVVDGDVDSLAPWWRRFDGGDDLSAAGRVSGRLETESSSAGLIATGTIDATLSTLSKSDRILAKDVRAAIVLTGQRAELRQAAGSVLGGQVSAAAGAPLAWLNPWLPSALQIAASASDSAARLEGTASFDAPALFELLGRTPLQPRAGGIELSAKLAASSPDLAAFAGDVRLTRADITAGELKYAQSEATRFRLADGVLEIESLDWRGPGSTVLGHGSVGLLNGRDTSLRLDVDTELGIVGALLSGRATGRLEGNLEVHGPLNALRLTSEATLRDASWLIPDQRILFADWSGQIRLVDRALSVTKLGGTVNGGSLRIDGRLPLEAGAAGGGLTIAARDILLDVPRGLHSQLGGDLVWERAGTDPRLRGSIEITSNRYTEPVTRILQLVNSASATRSGGASSLPSWLARTTLDIGLSVTDPILIDNSVSTVELMPDLRLGGTVDSPALSGRVDVVDDGRITIGGRTYRLRDSRVRFAPNDGIVPTVDAIGDTRIGDYDVTLRISGTPDRIETSFSSVPPLGERELQSLIVTGQTGEQATQSQSRQSEDKFAAAAAATDILGFAGKFVGLDSVRIGASDLDLVSKDVNAAQHLTVSKSLGSSFDLIFSDNLEDGSVTWVVVWKPTPVNEIRASSVEDGTRGIEFRRTLVFGPGSPAVSAARRPAASGSPAIVDTVRITGAAGFSHEELSKKIALDAGDRFAVRQWIEDRHRLETFYLDRGYHRVRIASSRSETADRSHISLNYDIERGPRTVIETSGDPLPADVLDAMYEAWRGLPIADLVRTEFDRIAREGLARRGYYQPTLRLDFAAETPELARVMLHVTRGPQARQLVVAWRGNRDVPNADLDALVAPHLADSAVWLDAPTLAWQVRQLYASRGHLQAQVSVGEPTARDGVATLPIAITEGVLSRLGGVKIEGVDPARMAAATEALALAVGEPLAASAPAEAGRRLKAFYAGLGYRSAAVTHTLTTAQDGSISIAWNVKEGPLYRVKDVSVVGVDATSSGLVQKAVTLAPGDAMSQAALDTTQRNLYDIGSFRRIDFDFGDSAIQPGGVAELPLTLTIQAEERQRFQLKYGVQFNFDRSTGKGGGSALGASVELRDQNFIGRAMQASVGAHWDPDLQTIGMLLSSPRLFGKRVRTNVYARDRREQDVLDSSTSFAGATLDDRRRDLTFEQRWRAAAALELVWGYNVSFRRFLLNQEDQHLDTGGLLAGPVVSVIIDRRDSPFDATRGFFHSSSFQLGAERLGSDLGYLRYLLRQSYYQPLGKLTAAGSVRYGTIQRYSGTAPVSIIDLFFEAGGTNTVRGYPEDSLSAINVGGFALGGTDLLVLNGELRFPISKRLGGAAFVDAGNTFASIADVTLGHLAVGAGLGLRIRTPLAPLRFDVAHPFSGQYGQHGFRVHFSIGQMF